MNIKNYEFLCETLERHGLSHPAINEALKTKMKLGVDEFEIGNIKLKFGAEEMRFAPKFGKGESRGDEESFYYLNKIKTTLTKGNGESVTAEFSLYKQRGFNTNEMHNLMNGRPVYRKPNNEEGRWAKVDFSTSDDNGNLRVRNYYDSTTNFSLTREIGKLPIVFANPQEKEFTLRDLQCGERITAIIKQDGKREEVVIGVSPQIGGLTLYNKEMEVIKHTNTHAIEMVSEMDLNPGNKTTQTATQMQGEKLPDSTKQLMEKITDQDNKQGQGQKQRKAS